MGSFVPARSARLSVVDRVFTRIGASDNLARGRSTFMVEMTETAAILHTATARSLILLDEVGRGTSTYDGLAIAWAAVEYLHARVRAKTLFATHYFELTELAELLSGVKNYHVSVKETGGGIAFLRKVEPGRGRSQLRNRSGQAGGTAERSGYQGEGGTGRARVRGAAGNRAFVPGGGASANAADDFHPVVPTCVGQIARDGFEPAYATGSTQFAGGVKKRNLTTEGTENTEELFTGNMGASGKTCGIENSDNF